MLRCAPPTPFRGPSHEQRPHPPRSEAPQCAAAADGRRAARNDPSGGGTPLTSAGCTAHTPPTGQPTGGECADTRRPARPPRGDGCASRSAFDATKGGPDRPTDRPTGGLTDPHEHMHTTKTHQTQACDELSSRPSKLRQRLLMNASKASRCCFFFLVLGLRLRGYDLRHALVKPGRAPRMRWCSEHCAGWATSPTISCGGHASHHDAF